MRPEVIHPIERKEDVRTPGAAADEAYSGRDFAEFDDSVHAIQIKEIGVEIRVRRDEFPIICEAHIRD
jgi:hypothetical protein